MEKPVITIVNKPDPEKIIRTLVDLWCDQKGVALKSIEIIKKPEKEVKHGKECKS